jgi:cell division protein FtsB
LGDYSGASRNAALLLSSKYRSKELELKGLANVRDEAQQIQFTLNDYRQPYQEQVARNNELTEEVEALRAQINAMQGKDQPRPPRLP